MTQDIARAGVALLPIMKKEAADWPYPMVDRSQLNIICAALTLLEPIAAGISVIVPVEVIITTSETGTGTAP